MKQNDLNRRDFHRLSMAAFGGVLAGTTVGCRVPVDNTDDGAATSGSTTGGTETKAEGDGGEAVSLLLGEKHVCRGLNMCKGKGGDSKNACAGQGICATYEHHSCHLENACKGQGGCGAKPGENACKGEGKCQVPLMDDAWKSARAAFEKAMADAGKTVGDAPPKPAANEDEKKDAGEGDGEKPAEDAKPKTESENS